MVEKIPPLPSPRLITTPYKMDLPVGQSSHFKTLRHWKKVVGRLLTFLLLRVSRKARGISHSDPVLFFPPLGFSAAVSSVKLVRGELRIWKLLGDSHAVRAHGLLHQQPSSQLQGALGSGSCSFHTHWSLTYMHSTHTHCKHSASRTHFHSFSCFTFTWGEFRLSFWWGRLLVAWYLAATSLLPPWSYRNLLHNFLFPHSWSLLLFNCLLDPSS